MAPDNAFQMVRFFCCACGFWNVCKYEPCGENAMAATPATRSLRTSLPVSQAYTVTASGVITAKLLPSSLNLAELHVILSIVATGSGAKGGPTNNDNPSGSLTYKLRGGKAAAAAAAMVLFLVVDYTQNNTVELQEGGERRIRSKTTHM